MKAIIRKQVAMKQKKVTEQREKEPLVKEYWISYTETTLYFFGLPLFTTERILF